MLEFEYCEFVYKTMKIMIEQKLLWKTGNDMDNLKKIIQCIHRLFSLRKNEIRERERERERERRD